MSKSLGKTAVSAEQCTTNAQNRTGPAEPDAQAIREILALPLTPDEKALAIRGLLSGKVR
ncbi:MAG: hypothetical protein ACHRHE_17525 [Tepidisphaerales bacterium]